MVGAVISTPNKIIGEGYHMHYGEAHAEVVAVREVFEKKIENLANCTIFVSLEPCNFHGNTPACTQLIIDHKIPNVVVSSIDKTEKVNFSGVQKLLDNGHEVSHGILKEKGDFLARIRNTYATKKRPYIILKYAQSLDGFIGQEGKQVWLSNSFSSRLVHKWRAELSAIIVGSNTAVTDNPKLTTRHFPGKSPLRICIDRNGRIPADSHLKNGTVPTWIYGTEEQKQDNKNRYEQRKILDDKHLLEQICSDLYQNKKDSLLVEGGAKLLQSFIDAGLWDCLLYTSPSPRDRG